MAGRMIGLLFCVLALSFTFSSARAEDISTGGRMRSFHVYRPPGLPHGPAVPLVVVLHGGFGTGAQAEKSYGWDEHAAAKGFVVVYPDGLKRSWNAGGECCGPALKNDVDDVGFLTALIRLVVQRENIDSRRIYVTGISNGAAMAYRYGCEGEVPVAAIASIAGTMPGGCGTPHPLSVLEIHGLQDRNIPFAGGKGTKGVTGITWPSVESSLAVFRKAGACQAGEKETQGLVSTAVDACAKGREIRLITIADAGHQWPGSDAARPVARLILGLDPPSKALNATETAWDFFARHPLP